MARVKQIPQIYRYKKADSHREMILFFASMSNYNFFEIHFELVEGKNMTIVAFSKLIKKICCKN